MRKIILITMLALTSLNASMCTHYSNSMNKNIEKANESTSSMRQTYLRIAIKQAINAKYACGEANKQHFDDAIAQIKSVR